MGNESQQRVVTPNTPRLSCFYYSDLCNWCLEPFQGTERLEDLDLSPVKEEAGAIAK